MLKLASMQYDTARILFEHIPHGHPIVFGVLDGNNPGQVFVNNAGPVTSALVCTGGNYFYLAGQADTEFMRQAAQQITEIQKAGHDKSAVVFCFDGPCQQELDGVLAPYGAFRIGRRIFSFDDTRHRQAAVAINNVQPGFTLKRMEATAGDKVGAAETWGSAGQFISKGFGWGLYCENELIAGCHTVFIGSGYAELSVFTEEKYARRGFAFLTASAAIAECLSRNLIPCWTCWDYNDPSAALAVKLGFLEQQPIQAHYWEYRQ